MSIGTRHRRQPRTPHDPNPRSTPRARGGDTACPQPLEPALDFVLIGCSEPGGEPVVGRVPAQLAAGSRAGVVVGVDDEQLGARSSRRSPRAPRCRPPCDSTVWCGAAGHQPRLGRGRQRRAAASTPRRPPAAAGSGLVGLDHVDLVGGQPEPVAEVGRCPTTTPGPGSAVNRSRTGSSRPPMPSGWISSDGVAGGDASGRPRACARRGSSPRPGPGGRCSPP